MSSPTELDDAHSDSDVLATPFGLSLDMSFSAFDEDFNYTLSLHSTGFTPSTKVTALRADGSTARSYTPPARSYKASFSDASGREGYAVATVLADGVSADVAVWRDGEMYHAQPASRYLAKHVSRDATLGASLSKKGVVKDIRKGAGKGASKGASKGGVHALQTLSVSSGGAGLAVHRASDISTADEHGTPYELCGGVAGPATETSAEDAGRRAPLIPGVDDDANSSEGSSPRHLLRPASRFHASTGREGYSDESDVHVHPLQHPMLPIVPGEENKSSSRSLLLSRWSSCFPGGPRRLHVGFAMDYASFLSLGGSVPAAEAHVAAIVAQTNAVYEQQLGVTLTVGEIVIMTEPGGSETMWNAGGDASPQSPSKPAARAHACPHAPQHLLSSFSRWRVRARPGRLGLWHLLTSCFPPPGTVGLAFMGSTCLSAASVGWSHMGSTAWLTVAHEIGHSLGAGHTFHRGRGRTGGLMDYGDGRIPLTGPGGVAPDGAGEYGFLTEYTKQPICAHITASLSGRNALFSGSTRIEPMSECWSTYAPRCGDGIVEGDEECDAGPLGNACCTPQCTLAPGATCASSDGECCVGCRSQPASVSCNRASHGYAGYCGPMGVCRSSECRGFSNTRFCGGVVPGNTCQEMCAFDDDTEHPEMCQEVTSDDMSLASGSHCILLPPTEGSNATSAALGRCQRPSVDARAVCVPVSLLWRAGEWGPCGCDGRQRRRVMCAEGDGTLVASDICAAAAAATGAGSSASLAAAATADEEVVPVGRGKPAEERQCKLERGQAAVCGAEPAETVEAI